MKISAICTAALVLMFLVLPSTPAHSDQGILEVRIKDHREAITDFARFMVTVEKISLSPKPGVLFWQTRWKDLPVVSRAIDLTQYLGQKTAVVFRHSIDSGAFDAFQLKIKSIEAVRKDHSAASVKNTVGPIKLSFEVPAGRETLLVVDLVVTDFSDHPPRGYELGLRGYELYTDGKLVDRIPPG
jgi:uncharacterized protein DUF4382